jgi:hypothetical protein
VREPGNARRFEIMTAKNGHTVREHFENRAPEVRETYSRILKTARKLGPVAEDPKKTSIHLVRNTAFAGVATRKTALILTLKSATDLASDRISKREQVSANRWHLEVRLESPAEVDREIARWIEKSYALSS